MAATDPTSAEPAEDFSELIHPLYSRALQVVYQPRPAPIVVPQDNKAELYTVARDTIGDRAITYLEFGVHEGWSFLEILRRFAHPDARFTGFDSFEGLPELFTSGMDRGHFSTAGKTPSVADWRASFVKGWFQNTVPMFLAMNRITGPVP